MTHPKNVGPFMATKAYCAACITSSDKSGTCALEHVSLAKQLYSMFAREQLPSPFSASAASFASTLANCEVSGVTVTPLARGSRNNWRELLAHILFAGYPMQFPCPPSRESCPAIFLNSKIQHKGLPKRIFVVCVCVCVRCQHMTLH